MKQALTYAALVVISVLYLLEIDFSNLDVFNWIALAVIAAVYIPTVIICVCKFKNWNKRRKENHEEKRKERQEK